MNATKHTHLKLGAIALVLCYVLVLAKPFQPYIQFVIQQDYIAKNLCIQKDKPMNTCQGKCHLAQLKQQSKEQPAKFPTISFSHADWISGQTQAQIEISPSTATITQVIEQHCFYSFNWNENPYPPPEIEIVRS